jgi:CubicO group peptidase (beta-lactamase class C family)
MHGADPHSRPIRTRRRNAQISRSRRGPTRGRLGLASAVGMAAFVIGGVTGAGTASGQTPPNARVDSIFRLYDSTHSPGCALGVIRDGDFVYRRGYGMANLELGVPNTPESVFRTGSVSKQFTAAAVLILAHEDALSLDDDVRKYLPELHPPYQRYP